MLRLRFFRRVLESLDGRILGVTSLGAFTYVKYIWEL